MLTEVEKKVFYGIITNEYSDGNPMKPVYYDTINCDVNPKVIPNVVTSLTRKGLVNHSNDELIWLTQSGMNLYKQMGDCDAA